MEFFIADPAGNITAFVFGEIDEKIAEKLMSDENLRRNMGEKGQKKSQCYHIDSIGKQWKQLFDELMQDK